MNEEQQERIMIYASYGVLGHEKEIIYTVGRPAGEIYEVTEYLLPLGWKLAENALGEQLFIGPEKEIWLANGILRAWGYEPALVWFDGGKKRRVILKESKE